MGTLAALALAWTTAAIAPHSAEAQTFTTLYSFCSQTNCTDGNVPYAVLTQATDGNFYGTTSAGGAYGEGTVFKITPGGTLTTLYSFCSQGTAPNCADGFLPTGGLVQATDGNFYGTTLRGGAHNKGTVFEITPGGSLITLHSFGGLTGKAPYAALIQGADRNLYGTTLYGGASRDGTIFKVTPKGKLTLLHSFDGTDGQYPYGGVIQASDGNLYGTTNGGGADVCCGTVFKITPSGDFSTLASFSSAANSSDGNQPFGGLVQSSNGDFYGTTQFGGATGCCGTVFSITPGGTLTTLHSFDVVAGGGSPNGLIQATDGDFYGTAQSGGTTDNGVVFKVAPDGTVTTLYSLCSQGTFPFCTDGYQPYAALIQATNGDFYGTTTEGGVNGGGIIFHLSVGLGGFVETQTTSGAVGSKVVILGNDLVGASRVTFNGVAARFTVVSESEITAKIPAGATTGFVEVTQQNGAVLQSNSQFAVTP
jgi:uncharacterized repeat protein (TIGR03803 family)